MSNFRMNTAECLKFISNIMEHLTDDQYRNILKGKGKLVYKEIKNKNNKISIEATENNEKMKEVSNKLLGLNSREEADQLLNKLKLKKCDLIKIAEQLGIHLLKKDTKSEMIQKIIEFAVGVRLRKKAIEETELKIKHKL
ncbi:hypothetical protein [Clostridium ganghwense]|uniref:Rho termination factor N-terminal domain-containing protein n=1 Tax=Clostridium ganghwense TaxID=312089 RepID=A0ABT4CK36_9CLOT|nr:hypothetical protein [Clostridium ganghwense]MCY6369407.1 hypothetical protein [Clostridium ganghwense]